MSHPLPHQKSSLKFLHICLSEAWGGLEMAVVRWNKILDKMGHVNFNLVTPGTRLGEALRANNSQVEEWQSDTYFSPAFTWKLRNFVHKMDVDVVTLQSLRDIWLVTPALWGAQRVKFIGFTQMMLSLKKTDILHRLMYSRLNYLCVLTEFQRRALFPYLPVPAEKYKVIPNFVDCSRFSPENRSEEFRQELGYGVHDFVIGVVGRIDPLKGQLETIKAFAQIRRKFLNAKLLLVGDVTNGEHRRGYKAACLAEVEQLNLQNHIQWLGFRKDIDKIMANLDLFLLPSHAETFGFVVIEAMASGVPVLASQAGGVPEILGKGQFGRLFKAKDVPSLAQQMAELIDDTQGRHFIAKEARKHVLDKYDRQKVYGDFMALLSPNR